MVIDDNNEVRLVINLTGTILPMSCIVSSRNGRFEELKSANVINSTFDMDLSIFELLHHLGENSNGNKYKGSK